MLSILFRLSKEGKHSFEIKEPAECYRKGLRDEPFLRQLNEPHVPQAEVNQILQQLLSQMVLDRLQEQKTHLNMASE